MAKKEWKTFVQVLSGKSDANIKFSDMLHLLNSLGFDCRIRGDHYIMSREDIVEIINLQPENGKVKRYEVRQVRAIIIKYGLEV